MRNQADRREVPQLGDVDCLDRGPDCGRDRGRELIVERVASSSACDGVPPMRHTSHTASRRSASPPPASSVALTESSSAHDGARRAATSAPRHAGRLKRKAAERPSDAGKFHTQTLNIEIGVEFAKSELELGIQSSKIPTLNSQIAARRLR